MVNLQSKLQWQGLDDTATSLLETLRDIAAGVQIQDGFRVVHPDYQPFELPQEVVERLKRLPEEVQERYWGIQLRSFLYGIYYNGSMQKGLSLGADSNRIYMEMENNSILGVDPVFFERLHDSNIGEGYFDPGWVVLRQEDDGLFAVRKGELTLHIDPVHHLQAEGEHPETGDIISIRMPKNFFQNGFYMSVGNAGVEAGHDSTKLPETVRIYFNLSPEGAVAMMSDLTRAMNELEIPFTFKVLYNPGDYGRHDSGVFYFEKSFYSKVQPILQKLYTLNQAYFGAEIPLFTKQLAPGLGVAEEPDQKFGAQESFGMNRCQIVANALLHARQQGDESPEVRLEHIFQHFSLLGLNWEKAYLNAGSEDIYTLLAL